MRISEIKKENGSMVVLMMIAIPLLVTMLAVVVDMGRITVARARLEVAVDRAAYTSAAVLSRALNNIASENWKIHKAWRDLDRDFKNMSQENEKAAEDRYKMYEAQRDACFDVIQDIQENMNQRAELFVRDIFSANAPNGNIKEMKFYGTAPLDDKEDESQYGKPRYDHIEGQTVYDPVTYKSKTYDALKFLVKKRGAETRARIVAEQEIRPMLLGKILGDKITVGASSASQAFGGSIEEFAKKETETIEDAELQVDDDGFDGLYRAAIIPMDAL